MLRKIKEFLKTREFISVATCDLDGRPNAAPKFLLKLEGSFIYLIDYTRGQTWQNLKINPRASLSFVDSDSLMGYQLNGSVQIISQGPEYAKIYNELLERQIDLSTKRIIEGVAKEKRHGSFEVAITDKFVILKIKIKEIVEIGPSGELKTEKIEV